MLQPKKTKFRKMQKGRMKGNAQRGHQLAFGSFGIKALEETWITARQIEAARIAVTRYMKRQGQVWIRIMILLACFLLNSPPEVNAPRPIISVISTESTANTTSKYNGSIVLVLC